MNSDISMITIDAEENGFVASYTHMGGKIGVLVDVETDVVNDAVKEMAKILPVRTAVQHGKTALANGPVFAYNGGR